MPSLEQFSNLFVGQLHRKLDVFFQESKLFFQKAKGFLQTALDMYIRTYIHKLIFVESSGSSRALFWLDSRASPGLCFR